MTPSAFDVLNIVVIGLAKELSRFGYKRTGKSLGQIFANGNVGFIGVQSSQTSTGKHAKIRLTYGICWIELFEAQYPNRKPTAIDVHIGGVFEGEDGADSWWSVRPDSDPRLLVERIAELALQKYIPWIEKRWNNDAIFLEMQNCLGTRIIPLVWREFLDRKGAEFSS